MVTAHEGQATRRWVAASGRCARGTVTHVTLRRWVAASGRCARGTVTHVTLRRWVAASGRCARGTVTLGRHACTTVAAMSGSIRSLRSRYCISRHYAAMSGSIRSLRSRYC